MSEAVADSQKGISVSPSPPACSPERGIREPVSGPRSWVCRRRSRQGRRLLSRAQVLPVRFQTQRERERETKGPLRRFCFTPTSSRGGRSVSGGEARPRPLTPRRSQASPAGAQHCHPRGQSFQTRRLILRRSRLERNHLIKVIERQDAVLLPEPRTIVARSGWNVERFSSSCFQNRHDGDLDPCAERSLWGTKPRGLSHSPPVIPPSPSRKPYVYGFSAFDLLTHGRGREELATWVTDSLPRRPVPPACLVGPSGAGRACRSSPP